MNGFNYVSVVLVETNAIDCIEQLLEIVLHCIGVRSIGKNFEQVRS